jgi:hypothetical protein
MVATRSARCAASCRSRASLLCPPEAASGARFVALLGIVVKTTTFVALRAIIPISPATRAAWDSCGGTLLLPGKPASLDNVPDQDDRQQNPGADM